MKKVLLTLIAISSVSAFAVPSRHECDLRDADVAHDVKLALDRFGVGEVTRTDVDFAKINQLNEQLECAAVVRGNVDTDGSYCSKDNYDLMTEYVNGIKEEAQAGQRTSADVTDARRLQISMRVICD
jgi:hypothetical protein